MTEDELATGAADLAERVKPLFAGQHPGVVGAALADLTSIWLASHVVEDDVHEALLDRHIELIRALLPISKDEIDERLRAGGGTA